MGDEPNKCKLKNGDCVRPNPWIEYLIVKGGEGRTRAELSEGYGAHDRLLATKCNRVRNRLQDRTQSIEFFMNELPYDETICSWFHDIVNHRIGPFNTRIIRKKIRQEMKKGPIQLTENFNADTLTVAQVSKIIDLIGKYYFNSVTEFRLFLDVPDLPFQIHVNNFGPGHAKHHIQAEAGIQSPELIGHNPPFYVGITINRSQFGAQWEPNRTTDGIVASSKLDGLIIAIEHEIVHIIMYRACINVTAFEMTTLGGHGPTFTYMNNQLFAHSPHIYTFGPAPAIVAPAIVIP
jgi:hypothetical protein